MSQTKDKFNKEAEKIAFDDNHRKRIEFNMLKYTEAVRLGKNQYSDLELAKKRAARIKRNVINDLEKHLKTFESNFQKNGGNIIWAVDAREAIDSLLEIVKKHNIKKAVKSKSMVSEEIDVNYHLQAFGVESIETDLGEYIVQIADEKPYHIVTPAMHKSKEDIAELYHEKFNTSKDLSPKEISHFTRQKLRNKFIEADMGITGGNFLIADTGAIAITENEGNAVLSMSSPKIHVAIVGIEKLIPSIKDLDLFWSLLSTHGTGQNATVYNSVVSGPKKNGEADGPEKMYVILLDNGRTKLLEKEHQKIALSCIKCGACLNVCPVYKTIGGHTYNTTYSGPIGAVIAPNMFDQEKYNHLSYASTLCGKCSLECPVNIPIHELLLHNRKDAVKDKIIDNSITKMMKIYKKVMKKRWIIEILSPKIKNIGAKISFKKAWGPRRKLPTFQESFSKQWSNRYK